MALFAKNVVGLKLGGCSDRVCTGLGGKENVVTPKWIMRLGFFMDSVSYGCAVDTNPIDFHSPNLWGAE